MSSTTLTVDAALHANAFALRPVRMVKDVAIHYSATTFPQSPRSGCERLLRILDSTGHLMGYPGSDLDDLWVDVLDDQGDILQEWPIDRGGFEYLRRKLRFVKG